MARETFEKLYEKRKKGGGKLYKIVSAAVDRLSRIAKNKGGATRLTTVAPARIINEKDREIGFKQIY